MAEAQKEFELLAPEYRWQSDQAGIRKGLSRGRI